MAYFILSPGKQRLKIRGPFSFKEEAEEAVDRHEVPCEIIHLPDIYRLSTAIKLLESEGAKVDGGMPYPPTKWGDWHRKDWKHSIVDSYQKSNQEIPDWLRKSLKWY